MSLARNYKQKILTQQRQSGAAAGDERIRVGEGKRDVVRDAAFKLDVAKISKLNSMAQRNEFKKQLIGKYAEQCKQFIATNNGNADVFIHSMIWLFDTGAYGAGLEYADIAIERGLPMPERFNRDVQTFAADAVLEGLNTPQMNQAAFDLVLERMRSGKWQVYEAIQYKYIKHLADAAFDASDWQAAFDLYSEADNVYDGAKVKTRLTEAKKKLEKTDNG